MNKQTVVVLDDQKMTLRAMEQNIGGKSDRQIILCQTLDEARKTLKENMPDFFITDSKLDNIATDVLEALSDIKNELPNTKVIVITGKMDITEEDAREKGADFFLRKPIDWQRLEQIISPIRTDHSLNQLLSQLDPTQNIFLMQVLESMNGGLSIVDLNRNVLYANKKQINTSGAIFKGEPCYKSFAPYSNGFCDPCPIDTPNVIVTQLRSSGYYESQCIPLKDSESNVIAYAIISIEVTDREKLFYIKNQIFGTMPLKERCKTLLKAIKAMGFSESRLFLTTEDGQCLIGYASSHSGDEKERAFIGKIMPIVCDRYSQTTFNARKPHIFMLNQFNDPWAEYLPHKQYLKEWAEIPLLKLNKPVGLITVDNYDENYPDMVYGNIRPINIDALKEINKMAEFISEAVVSEIEMIRQDIDLMIRERKKQIKESSTIARKLSLVLYGAIEIISHYWSYAFHKNDFAIAGYIMQKDGAWLRSIAESDIYRNKGNVEFQIYNDPEAPYVKAIDSGVPIIYNTSDNDNWKSWVGALTGKLKNDKKTVKYLENVKSVGCFPLKIKDEIIGLMSLQSHKPFIFNIYTQQIIEDYISEIIPELEKAYAVYNEKKIASDMGGVYSVMDILLREKENEENLIWSILTGLTHHEGLGYNRAVYLEFEPSVGYKVKAAVGPIDRIEADALYASKQIKTASLGEAIINAKESNQYITKFIAEKCLPEGFVSSNSEIVKGSHPVFNDQMASDEFVVLPISCAEINYGCIVLDNLRTGRKTSHADIEILNMAIGLFALVLHNMRMHKDEEYELLSMIFHRLRTDIAGPLDAIEVAQEPGSTIPLDLDLMKEKLWDVLMNTNDLLSYSKSRLKMLFPVRTEVKVSELVSEIIADFSFRRDVSLIENSLSSEFVLYADHEMLKHILLNLIDNAVKYSPNNSMISISANDFGDKDTGLIVRNRIKNTMDEDIDLCDLFGRFKRGGNSQGEGVGLYIVKKIIEAHGGSVIARLEDDAVVFGFTIPKRQEGI